MKLYFIFALFVAVNSLTFTNLYAKLTSVSLGAEPLSAPQGASDSAATPPRTPQALREIVQLIRFSPNFPTFQNSLNP